MPDHILKHPNLSRPRWAKFAKDSVKWIQSAAQATTFTDEELAYTTFHAARAAMIAKAQIKVDALILAGHKITTPAFEKWARDPEVRDIIPGWITERGFEPLVDIRAAESDLRGLIELWFVKCEGGWVGAGKDNGYRVKDAFHEAQPFPTLISARNSVGLAHAKNACYIKGSMAFSQVVTDTPHSLDDLALGIASACEARAIGADIEAATLARMAELAPASSKPKLRL